ncbi:hypothetical protein [Marispirochaeta sp.]|uniref:hypothetical protein n=1 Tax=Marispirochaeta sp. TaxID=2038653 RepID=UPI0029C94849|nr:hypothetical protein [Marispirochaeta sp.]
MKNWLVLAAILFSVNSILLCAENNEEDSNIEEEFEISEDDLLFGRYTPGIIFNTSNILLDLNEYQSGVGVKLKANDYALRGLFNIGYESGADLFEMDLGLTYEKPFFTGRVAPYWGVAVNGGYSLDRDEYDSDNWNEYSDFIGGLSAIFGTEVYIFDFLSLFAEYSIGFSISRATVTQKSSGVESDDTTINYNIGTGLGNAASIGIVIYLEKQPINSNDIHEEND